MCKINITTDTLLNEIESVFPCVEMPHLTELTFHKDGCVECDYMRGDLEQYRGKNITGDIIRLIHQELSLLSANTWRWILPHYLRFCLTSEGQYNQMETEFLIYNLGPDIKYQSETLQRLSHLNNQQILCLIHFLEWCSTQKYWREFFPDNLNKAKKFLSEAITENQIETSPH